MTRDNWEWILALEINGFFDSAFTDFQTCRQKVRKSDFQSQLSI